jgi:predicted Zn-dependent protease
MNHRHRNSPLLLAFAALLGATDLCALPLPQDANPCTVNVNVKNPDSESLEKRSELGQQLAKEVERSSRIVDDPIATEYINLLAQKLARNSDPRITVKVKIADSTVKDELILPGGLIYINDGLIHEAKTEAELAGALAYGIAHTALRPGTEQAPSHLTQVDSIASMIFVPYGWTGYGSFEGMNLAFPLSALKEQRELVLATDSVGLRYLYETGYDPEHAVRLLERISTQTRSMKNTHDAFSAFPSVALRAACMRKQIARFFPTRDEAIISSSEFDKVQERLSSRKLTDSQPVPPPVLRKPTDP